MRRYLFIIVAMWALVPLCCVAKKRPIRVTCVGNSITYGIGVQEREVDSYPAQLQTMLGEGYEVGNFGVSGATLINRAWHAYMKTPEWGKALDFAGDIAIVHLGINDTDPRSWPNYRDDFVRDYLLLIDSLRQRNPQCRVILARLTPISDRHRRFQSGTRDWHQQITQAIETVAEVAGCELIDFFEPLHCRPELFPDGLHPNREGYSIMAGIVCRAITGEYGGLQLPACYTDNMVLPRNREFAIRGKANPGESVTMKIGKQVTQCQADGQGNWQMRVEPLTSGETYTLTLSTKNKTLKLNNILAGELWLCSGQSNMQFQLQQDRDAARQIAQAQNPNIRLLNLQPRWSTGNFQWPASALDSVNRLLYYEDAQWQECTPEDVPTVSAVGYYFAQELQQRLGCPIGLIGNAVGGSGCEAWIDRSTLEWEFPNILRDWTQNDFIQDWVRGRAETNMGKGHDALQRHPYQPCYLYEASIQQLRNLPISGVIWYQGESNAHNMECHERLFHLLLQSWRKAWDNPSLPFGFVQLSSLDRPSWPWFRNSQRLLSHSEQHVGMAVSSDCGDSLNVHPTQKQPVGHRLALWALHDVYGQSGEYASPEPQQVEWGERQVVITYDHGQGLTTSDGQAPRTFEVAHTDGLYYPAEAKIEGNKVVLQCAQVQNPRYVRYGWQPFTRANLVNGAGLPASTYRYGEK